MFHMMSTERKSYNLPLLGAITYPETSNEIEIFVHMAPRLKGIEMPIRSIVIVHSRSRNHIVTWLMKVQYNIFKTWNLCHESNKLSNVVSLAFICVYCVCRKLPLPLPHPPLSFPITFLLFQNTHIYISSWYGFKFASKQ